ncbi:hypothetical protein [Microbacterium capsulatum]|uniref:Uncharacterized protein n=1 Tax=Microbacterium capsulatum TaxID=3041921 RepID=A0ABU0XGI4_9MICO|nr:hypothetical protein [Microbacterium sp. ASV81]MDQ4214247.1 hypothetical protein [Microbacterium sp. ASV81]
MADLIEEWCACAIPRFDRLHHGIEELPFPEFPDLRVDFRDRRRAKPAVIVQERLGGVVRW